MKNSDTMEIQAVDLESLEAKSLPELQGWKEKQLQIVDENPYVEITDNKTYEDAKKSRTALVTARTSIEKQEKIIASKLKSFRDKVGEASAELISITLPHEQKQQEEVKRYEAEKQREREEKERIERERKEAIQKEINDFYNNWKAEIQNADSIEDFEVKEREFNKRLVEISEKDFEEFELDLIEKQNLLLDQLEERKKYMVEKEEARKENEHLAEERKKLAAEREAMEAANKKAEEERAAKEAQLQKEREAVEAEKQRLKEEECERQRKAEKERKAKEEADRREKAEAEKKRREEALRPDKEKLEIAINSISFGIDEPILSEKDAIEFLQKAESSIQSLKAELINELSNL
tara:strand:- start:1159 stop:2211 length:1053 start_codon:yes stop_codon:yes gene_type:complete